MGIKVRRLPPVVMNGRSPHPKDPEMNGHTPLSMQGISSQSLIMNRKALRKAQRKASSTICSVQ